MLWLCVALNWRVVCIHGLGVAGVPAVSATAEDTVLDSDQQPLLPVMIMRPGLCHASNMHGTKVLQQSGGKSSCQSGADAVEASSRRTAELLCCPSPAGVPHCWHNTC
jgi:hypothetical protein